MSEYAAKMRPDSVRLELIHIEITRETAEWMLADLAKRGKRLQQSVSDAHTRTSKREKRESELTRLAYAADCINHALNQNKFNNNANE